MKKVEKNKKMKIALDDLKVQSFVTSLSEAEKNKMAGGVTGISTTCSLCPSICTTFNSCC